MGKFIYEFFFFSDNDWNGIHVNIVEIGDVLFVNSQNFIIKLNMFLS